MDSISKWLIIVRCCVFPMTMISAAIGGLLAASVGRFEPLPFALAAVGLLLAHAANNMINDYFDLETGLDTAEYARAQYAPHPVLSGMVTREQRLIDVLRTYARPRPAEPPPGYPVWPLWYVSWAFVFNRRAGALFLAGLLLNLILPLRLPVG
jgi:hypothetical protein